MKKTIIATAVILLITLHTKAQILNPVHWSYAAKKMSNTEAVVFIKATIDEGWHIYSQTVKDGGPIKSSFTFASSKEYALDGTTMEPKPITTFEKVFNMDVSYFENSVIFQQKIKLSAGTTVVKGKLEYMTCNNKQCLQPTDVDFSVPVK